MDTIKEKIIFALEKLPLDMRDYSHHKRFGTLGASMLPTGDFTVYDSLKYTIVKGDNLSMICSRFGYSVSEIMSVNSNIISPNKIYAGQILTLPARKQMILNQWDLDFCTAFTTSELQYLLYGIPFDPLYQMAKIKQIRGEYKSYGANLRDECNSIVKYGSLPLVLGPYTRNGSIGDKPRDFLANWINWPLALDTKSSKYKDLSYFTVDGPYDMFDNIRSCLQIHRQERRAVSFGLFWHNEWTEASEGIISDIMPTGTAGGGHNMAIIGQKTIDGKLYLIFQQSWSDRAGDNGVYYFPRSIVDQLSLQGYGAYTFSRIDNSGLKSSNWLMGLLTSIFNHNA